MINNDPRTYNALMDPIVPIVLANATATAHFTDDSDIELLTHARLATSTLED